MSQQNLKKSIARVGYAVINTDDENNITYDKIVWLESKLAGGREYSASPNGEVTEVYADGIIVYNAEENNGYDITITLLAAIDRIEKDWLGNVITENGAVIESADEKDRNRFALVLIEDSTNKKGITTIYPNCYVSTRPKISGKTSEGKFEAQYPEYSLAARPDENHKVCRIQFPNKSQFESIPEFTAESCTIPNLVDLTKG